MTPHIEAKKEEIANIVIMPGDPLRAKYIVENYLEDYKLINDVRGMLGYTGFYKGKRITVMASGMGMPSMGIYSYELYKFYDVDYIIRIGTAGSYTKDLKVFDLVLVDNAFSESTYALVQNGYDKNIIKSSSYLNSYILETAKNLNKNITLANIHSSDVFYKENDNFKDLLKQSYLACEMESFALFHNANVLNKKAACILTISNNIETNVETTSEQREKSLNDMILLALESTLKL